MDRQMQQLLKRFAMAMAGQALPETSALATVLKDAQRGMLATVVTGVLIASIVLLASFGFYLFLQAEAVGQGMAVGLTLGLLALLTIISGLLAGRYVSRTQRAKQKLGFFSKKHEPQTNEFEEIMNAFLQGLLHEEPSSSVVPKKQQSTSQEKSHVFTDIGYRDPDTVVQLRR